MSELFWAFSGRKSKRGCQNGSISVQKTFFLVKNLKYPQMFLFPVLTAKNIVRKNFGRLVKIVLVLSKKNILRKNSFFEIFVYFLSGFLSHIVLPYGRRNLANLSKHQLTCPKEHFSRWKNLIIAQMCSFCVLTAKKILREVFADLSEKYLCCPQ